MHTPGIGGLCADPAGGPVSLVTQEAPLGACPWEAGWLGGDRRPVGEVTTAGSRCRERSRGDLRGPGVTAAFSVVLGCRAAVWQGAGYRRAPGMRADSSADVGVCHLGASCPESQEPPALQPHGRRRRSGLTCKGRCSDRRTWEHASAEGLPWSRRAWSSAHVRLWQRGRDSVQRL